MGGPANFAGTTYQQGVHALVLAHVLAEAPLGWMTSAGEVPTLVIPETGGPGDDIQVVCGDGPRFEAQAKSGLNGKSEVRELLARLQAAPDSSVVLVVDTLSAAWIRGHFKKDLQRLRSGRDVRLSSETQALLAGTSVELQTLKRLFVMVLDVARDTDLGTHLALALLRDNVLEDPAASTAAWALLTRLAAAASADQLQHRRSDLVGHLQSANVKVRPRRPNERWTIRLESTKRLIDRNESEAALGELKLLAREADTAGLEPRLRYRLAVQLCAAHWQLGDYPRALAFANQALEIDPKGKEALQNAAIVSWSAEDLASAQAFAERAVEVAPLDPGAWGALARITQARGLAPREAPPEVAKSTEYQIVQADLATGANNLELADSLTSEVIRSGVRTLVSLTLRARTILAIAIRDGGSGANAAFQEVVQLTSEAIDLAESDRLPLVKHAHGIRGEALGRLGKVAEAAADTELLQTLDPEDPDVLLQSARADVRAGRTETAFVRLSRPVTDQYAELLGFRASLAVELGRQSQARADLEAAERKLGDSAHSAMTRLALSEVAIELGDLDRAERLMANLPPEVANRVPARVLRARLVWHRGDRKAARIAFVDAAEADAHRRAEVLVELAQRLLRVGEATDAVDVLDLVGESSLPDQNVPLLARALHQSGSFTRLQALVERLAAKGPLPLWAVEVAVDLAGRREDVEAQVTFLGELVRHRDGAMERLVLASHLIELGRPDDARSHIDAALAMSSVSPEERMQAALFLRDLGEHDRAISIAFAAYREKPDDAQIARGFFTVAVMSRAKPRVVVEVGPDTHVELIDEDGAVTSHTVYAGPPIDASRGECNVDDARALGILGRRVGEDVDRQGPVWSTKSKVKSIVPAEVHAIQDIGLNYERRFPRAPFFLSRFHVGDGTHVKDLVPLVSSLDQRKQLVERAFAVYKEEVVPLGLLSEALGAPIPALMARGTGSAAGESPLWCEWADQGGQDQSRKALSEAKVLVLTRSALHTAFLLGIQDVIRRSFGLVAPRSLRVQLDAELRDAEREVRDGQATAFGGPTGLSFAEIEPGHPSLVRAAEAIRAQRDWVIKGVELHPRPIEIVATEGESQREMRKGLGAGSYDASALAFHLAAVLWADDLGLRKVSILAKQPSSCSTTTLLAALAERGVMSPDDRDRYLVELISRRYAAVRPTVELLTYAIRNVGSLSSRIASSVVGTLGAVPSTPFATASILVEVIRAGALSNILTMSTKELTQMGIVAMSSSWNQALVVRAVSRRAQERLQLLPRALRECLEACTGMMG